MADRPTYSLAIGESSLFQMTTFLSPQPMRMTKKDRPKSKRDEHCLLR